VSWGPTRGGCGVVVVGGVAVVVGVVRAAEVGSAVNPVWASPLRISTTVAPAEISSTAAHATERPALRQRRAPR
jgi:hypothetical protein